MLAWIPGLIRVPIELALIGLNIIVHVVPLLALTLVKLLLPWPPLRRACARALVLISESWIGVNNALFAVFTRIAWTVEGTGGLSREKSYLVVCNHQSWVDIAVLQKVFNRRIPFMRFFLKSQLIWVPFLGLAWWALDFPFMRRYSAATVMRHPELRGKDMEATRRACAKFRHIPVSMMNFVEGTRFTAAKHAAQSSPFRHLLRPRAGGVTFVLEAMGEALHAVLDVTIVYPDGPCTMVDLLLGRLRRVRVLVRELPIGAELRAEGGGDPAFRGHVKAWAHGLWSEKDAAIERLYALDAARRATVDETGG